MACPSIRRLLSAIVALLLAGGSAQAGFLQVTEDPNKEKVVNLWFSGWNRSYEVYAGPVQGKYSTTNSTFSGPAADMYCVDLYDFISPPTTYAVNLKTSNDGLTHGSLIAALLATHGNPSDATQYAALQLAIWKSEYDGYNTDFTAGSVTLDMSYGIDQFLASKAAEYMKDANNYNTNGSHATATWYESYTDANGYRGQSMVTIATPVPSTFILAILAVVCFGGINFIRRHTISLYAIQ